MKRGNEKFPISTISLKSAGIFQPTARFFKQETLGIQQGLRFQKRITVQAGKKDKGKVAARWYPPGITWFIVPTIYRYKLHKPKRYRTFKST